MKAETAKPAEPSFKALVMDNFEEMRMCQKLKCYHGHSAALGYLWMALGPEADLLPEDQQPASLKRLGDVFLQAGLSSLLSMTAPSASLQVRMATVGSAAAM